MQQRNRYFLHEKYATPVSYLEIEEAAIGILLAGAKPSTLSVRKALGDRGSAQTILAGLKRFWLELGLKAKGDPSALSRLPMEISEAVEGIWQRALTLAAQSARTDENAAREQLERLRITNEVRDQSITLREREWDARDRERETALADARDQQLASLRLLAKDRATLTAQERRIGELEKLIAFYREQLAAIEQRLATPARPARARQAIRKGKTLGQKLAIRRRAVRVVSAREEPEASVREAPNAVEASLSKGVREASYS